MVQTHASWVFIAAPFVFKVKKPVNLGFLDFSTLAKRRHFCEREVALNRRLSKQTYLGVIPIMRNDGSFSIGGRGRVVEYAVKMRHLAERGFLDRMLARGAVGVKELDRVANVLTGFYRKQHPTPAIERWGLIRRLKISTDENFRQAKPFVGRTISAAALTTLRSWTNAFYRRHAALFAARIREGRIRDCHGDLHLEHIHFSRDAVAIFDCIEFNDRFRYVDVASDLAFLAMDLDFHGRADLATYFAGEMAERLKDPDLLRLLNFYKTYRAFVRGKVESLHSLSPGAESKERGTSENAATRYFRLALNYTVAGSRPLVLVIMGRIASGKSTLAHALGGELDWPVISSDRIRKELAGVPPTIRLPDRERRQLYSERMTDRTYSTMCSTALRQVRAGKSVILDATFSRRKWRRELERHFSGRDACLRFVEVRASDAAIKAHLRRRSRRFDEISDARIDDFTKLTGSYERPDELPHEKCVRVSTGRSFGNVLRSALRELAVRQLPAMKREGSLTNRRQTPGMDEQ